MKQFAYLRDPLFLAAAAVYALNRWWLTHAFASPFLHGYLNDLLLLPAALPVVLWVQRRLGLRERDGAPAWTEMWLHLAVWSVICEVIGPHCWPHGTADTWDVLAYALGGVAACLWWQRPAKQVLIRRS